MNYISHLQLAAHTETSLVGSFLGDFVKGSDLGAFNEEQQLGIILHRKVDSFTDKHPEIREAKALFPHSIRRYAGIVLDIYFDHLLIRNWHLYSSQNVEAVFDSFYRELEEVSYTSSKHYTKVRSNLLEYQWLSNYFQSDTCLKAMKSIEGRFRHSARFADEAFHILTENKGLLGDSFGRFYPDLMNASFEMIVDIEGTVAQQSLPSNS